MPLPNVNTNLNSVPMDYFLRGVDAVKPRGAPPAGQGPAEAEAVPAPEEHPAGRLVSQLDVLLMKAARASTKSLDGDAVKKTFQKLVDDGALGRDSLKLLAKAADKAAKTLKALDKFTGRQLAEAFDANGRFSATSTKAGKAVAAAIQAQQGLSDLLAQLGNGLGAMARHEEEMRASNPQFKGVDADLFNEVNDFRQLCDRRATEISELAHQMKEFAVRQAADGQNADPNVAAILRARVDELLPRQALAMHGTADALATVSADVTDRLRPLAEKIDAFRRDPSATIQSEAFRELQGDIAAMKAAVREIRTNGIAVGKGRMVVAKDVVAALEREVARAEELFATARDDVARKILGNYVETARSVLCTNGYLESQYGGEASRALALQRRGEVLAAMDALAAAALDPGKTPDQLNALVADLTQKGTRLLKAAAAAKPARTQNSEPFDAMLRRLGGAGPVVLGLIQLVKLTRNRDRFFTGAEAMAIFQGELSVSSVVEARARGLQDADVNPANEDANIVAERELGAGKAGTVVELTRSDGTSVVFKGETESRSGLALLAAGAGKAYEMDQQAVNLNFAAKSAADALRMPGMVVDYSAGAHRGVFGFFMGKAKGMTPNAIRQDAFPSSPDAGLTPKQIRRLPAPQRRQVRADLQRELNRLQWLDLVTGQSDRHWENYFVHVDPATRKVTVTGIDNDAGYSQYRVGAAKFSFDKDRTALFKFRLKLLAQQIDPRHANEVLARLLKDPGLSANGAGGLDVDATRIKDKIVIEALKETTGIQGLALPDKIDRETYDALVALKAGPAREAYLDAIRPRLSEGCFRAAVSRLDDVIAHAEALERKGDVLEGDAWLDRAEQPLGTGDITVRKQDGGTKRIGGTIAQNINILRCPSYFARDLFDRLFA